MSDPILSTTGLVESIGSLKVLYYVAEHTETRAEHWSYAVSGNPDNLNCSMCFGLRLKLPNEVGDSDFETITSVTMLESGLNLQKEFVPIDLDQDFMPLEY